jgi:hypothetical protein
MKYANNGTISKGHIHYCCISCHNEALTSRASNLLYRAQHQLWLEGELRPPGLHDWVVQPIMEAPQVEPQTKWYQCAQERHIISPDN